MKGEVGPLYTEQLLVEEMFEEAILSSIHHLDETYGPGAAELWTDNAFAVGGVLLGDFGAAAEYAEKQLCKTTANTFEWIALASYEKQLNEILISAAILDDLFGCHGFDIDCMYLVNGVSDSGDFNLLVDAFAQNLNIPANLPIPFVTTNYSYAAINQSVNAAATSMFNVALTQAGYSQ